MPNSLENRSFGGKNKTQSFQKLFVGRYLFVFVEYLCNRSPKIKTKNIKNYSSILAIVNHRNWLPAFEGGESLHGLFSAAQQVNLLTWVCSPHTPFNFELEAEQL